MRGRFALVIALIMLFQFETAAQLSDNTDICSVRPDLCNDRIPEKRARPSRRPSAAAPSPPRPQQSIVTFESYLNANARHPALLRHEVERKAFPDPVRRSIATELISTPTQPIGNPSENNGSDRVPSSTTIPASPTPPTPLSSPSDNLGFGH